MGRLDGKVALITGAAQGIGEAAARRFVKEGARVAVADLDADSGQKVADSLGSAAHFISLDVTNPEQWQAAMDSLFGKFGQLDILVNNAGVSPGGSIEDATLEQWRDVNKINGDSVFLGCKFGVKAMKKGSGGSIINLSSTTGIRANGTLAAYSSSKGAVRLLTKSVALHAGQYKIRCNSVHPGGTQTRMLDAVINKMPDPESARVMIAERYPLGRVGKPEDIANMILFLASDEASWVTGAEFVIDGGSTL